MHALAGFIARNWSDDLGRQRHLVLRGYICVALLIIGGFCFLSGPYQQVSISLWTMAALALVSALYIWRGWGRGTCHPCVASDLLCPDLQHLLAYRWLGLATNFVAGHHAPALLGVDGLQRHFCVGRHHHDGDSQLVWADMDRIPAAKFCF